MKKEIKKMVKNYLPFLQKNNYPDDSNKGLLYSYDELTGTIIRILTQEEFKYYYSPIDYTLSQKDIAKNYSEQYVKEKFIELYHKILNNEADFDIHIKDLVNSFSIEHIKPFLVVSEIDNIKILDDMNYEVADSTFKIWAKEDTLNKGEDFISFTKNLIDKPIIFTNVEAGEENKAKELAIHNFIISFNLLKLYAPDFRPMLKGSSLSETQQLILYNKKDNSPKTSSSQEGDILHSSAYLNKELYQKLNNAGISELKNSSDISKIIKNCLYWFGLGLQEKTPSAKLLNFAIVLEAVLKKKDEDSELGKSIANRGATFLYSDIEQKKRAIKELKDIYDARCKIVHTGKTSIKNKDVVSNSYLYTKYILQKLIEKSKDFDGNFDKFLDDISYEKETTGLQIIIKFYFNLTKKNLFKLSKIKDMKI